MVYWIVGYLIVSTVIGVIIYLIARNAPFDDEF
jgi:hypothetical protein